MENVIRNKYEILFRNKISNKIPRTAVSRNKNNELN